MDSIFNQLLYIGSEDAIIGPGIHLSPVSRANSHRTEHWLVLVDWKD